MESLLDHLDLGTVTGRLIVTGLLIAIAVVIGTLVGRLGSRRSDDQYRRYYIRKGSHYVVGVIAAVGTGIVWRPFAGQLGIVVGLLSAGIAFALQNVIGSFAGGLNIVSSSVFRVGDRIELGGVAGDVIDLTPTRTRIMEIGSSVDSASWVHGRQYTGRIVSIANGAAFTQPVYNYSATFGFTWEEVTVPIAYRDNWKMADTIMLEEATLITASEDAAAALKEMVVRYPIARTEVASRVFARATDNYLELTARFIVPARQARQYHDRFTRAVLDRLEHSGITVASSTSDITLLTDVPAP